MTPERETPPVGGVWGSYSALRTRDFTLMPDVPDKGIPAEQVVALVCPWPVSTPYRVRIHLPSVLVDVDAALLDPTPHHRPLAIQLTRDLRDVPLVPVEQSLDLGVFGPGTRRPAA